MYKGLSFKDIDKNLKLFMILNALFALGAFTYSFLLVYAKKFGFKIAFVPVLYLVYTATASVFSLPFGRLSDRIGRKPVLMMAFGFWAVVCLGIIFSRSLLLIGSVFIFYGLHKAALDPVQRTLLCELSPPSYRASTLGAFQMVIGLCALPASLTAGILWEKFGAFAPFGLSLGLTAGAFALLFLVKEKKPEGSCGPTG